MKAISLSLAMLALCFCAIGCVEGDALDPVSPESTSAEPDFGKADISDQFFQAYFLTQTGTIWTSDDAMEVERGDSITMKFFAPRDYSFEGGITAYIYDAQGRFIPYGTAYDVRCGEAGDYMTVREEQSTETRYDEPVCTIQTDNLYAGEYTIGWEFYEYTYEGDWDWFSTRTLETGHSNLFIVIGY